VIKPKVLLDFIEKNSEIACEVRYLPVFWGKAPTHFRKSS